MVDWSERSPERDSLLAAVHGIGAVVRANAVESERLRRLAPASVQAISAAGLFELSIPRELGGREADPWTQIEVIEAMTRIDGAAGWCLLIGASETALAGGYLSDRAVAEIFERRPVICAGLVAPSGAAVRVPGGYRVSGRGGWASGIHHATWLFTSAVITPDSGGAPPPGPPPMISFAAPISSVEIEDTWHTSGLKGTGSTHYHMNDIFVPEDFTCPFPNAAPRRGGPMFRLPFPAFLIQPHIGFALGAAQRALDEITAVAGDKILAWSQTKLRDDVVFQSDLGRAKVELDAARAYAERAVAAAWASARRGVEISLEEWASLRLATTHVTDVAARITTLAYRYGGGSAVYESSAIQRYFRDMHMATQHIVAGTDAYELGGKVLLGVGEMHPFMAPRPPAPTRR